MKSGLPPLIRQDLVELRSAEATAGAVLEAMAERRPFSDVKSRKVTVIGPHSRGTVDANEVFTCLHSTVDTHN